MLLKLLYITRLGRYRYRKPPTNFSDEAKTFCLVDEYGGQGQNRTADTGIFRASKINKLLIMVEQEVFGTVWGNFVYSTGYVRLA